MASPEKKHLENVLKPYMKEKGFKKKGGTWCKDVGDFLQVVNIQGSPYSKMFYINLAVYIKALGNNVWPAEHDCHIRIRLNSFCLEQGVTELLNYEDYGFDGQPREKLLEILESDGLPWLDKCSSFKGAKREYVLPNRVMTKHKREALDEYFN
ncbi:DUF4304 domain-containing protein [Alteromonas sp. 009811495]|uniref:DUF4304 domain-containing protein n=1 Tax=Alteromonas sp. 009811495 TaxID=3002962 RepID=UPI00237DA3BF|nr:DUF4304 domain-containing protein [Alteromonas sp. 009811495]WDT84405.1 DUF4304 domain-containing protein [Alteromonas sp. 009811495]